MPTEPSTPSPAAAPIGSRLMRIRPWVQTAFLAVWLAPLGRAIQGIPGCVYHCYSCPLSSVACPIGVAANTMALLPAAAHVPYLLIGVLLLVGAAVGSLVCGWACPFGFLQDLLARATRSKVQLPGWIGHGRYLVLVGLVLILPYWLGSRGVPYDEQSVSICRLCPAGALEAGLPYSIQSWWNGGPWMMGGLKLGILLVFMGSAILIRRPWCRIFCPLGGLLALFNRFSLFHLRFRSEACRECNLCRAQCPMGLHVDEDLNAPGCVRCLECTRCGAILPALSKPAPR
ncbi:MAG TPA: 4Fe-4S binding protein [Verrucomicrobiota bacterium]|nr:4Fe-4S binding protein [Verrucomicrobiota bacterium]